MKIRLQTACAILLTIGLFTTACQKDALRKDLNISEIQSASLLDNSGTGRLGRIEGKISPLAAKPTVVAILGTVVIKPTSFQDGEFKFRDLQSGTYTIFIDATANNYQDKTINNVVVKRGEDTKLGTIYLTR
jgi:hypothetical protein